MDSVTYNQFGQMNSINLGNGIQTTYGYYGLGGTYDTTGGYYGKLWENKSVNGSTVLQDVRHTWDAVGNLTQRQDLHTTPTVTENFSYDYLDRLTGVTGVYCAEKT